MIRWLRRFTCGHRLHRFALGFIAAEMLVSLVLVVFPLTVSADDCNDDWTRAED